MSITIQMSDQDVAAIKELTQLQDEGEAIKKAAQEFLRLSRLRELKLASGKVEWSDQSEKPVTVGKLNEFLRSLPPLGDDVDDFSRDVRAIRAEFPAERDTWD